MLWGSLDPQRMLLTSVQHETLIHIAGSSPRGCTGRRRAGLSTHDAILRCKATSRCMAPILSASRVGRPAEHVCPAGRPTRPLTRRAQVAARLTRHQVLLPPPLPLTDSPISGHSPNQRHAMSRDVAVMVLSSSYEPLPGRGWATRREPRLSGRRSATLQRRSPPI